jgi:hypothetical protein
VKVGRCAARVAPSALPLAILVLPKCPLCLLPVLAAAGSALPPAPLLNGLVVTAAAAWLVLVWNRTRLPVARCIAVSCAVLLLCGRWLDAPAASWIGVALMVAVVSRVRAPGCARRLTPV